MRMISPSCGECVDRITILQLKIAACLTRNLDANHFELEKYSIEQYVSRTFPKAFTAETIGKYIELNKELEAVNRNLWKLEDEIRSLMQKNFALRVEDLDKEDTQRALEVAFLIPLENDKRAKLVREISSLVSGSEQGLEKLY